MRIQPNWIFLMLFTGWGVSVGYNDGIHFHKLSAPYPKGMSGRVCGKNMGLRTQICKE
jgi:hypothetical protein